MPNFCKTRSCLALPFKDIARALATLAGVKAVSDFDAGLTSVYLNKAEALLELATEFAKNVATMTSDR